MSQSRQRARSHGPHFSLHRWAVAPGTSRRLDRSARLTRGLSGSGDEVMRTINGLKEELHMPPFPQSAIEDSSKITASRSRLPLLFFLLIIALSVPLWVLGSSSRSKGFRRTCR
jgi:hypothetical protein